MVNTPELVHALAPSTTSLDALLGRTVRLTPSVPIHHSGTVKRLLILVCLPLLAGCGRLGELQYDPPVTPEQWCQQRPCVVVGGTVLNEPLGTFLVFFLAALWIGVGAYFVASRRSQRSRGWLGAALILGGVGAAQAGVSYQAFSYELKCAGRQICAYTNGFEVGYSVTQAWSVSAMLIAVAFACVAASRRRSLVMYAVANAVIYCGVAVAGVVIPSAALLLVAVNVAYFAYYAAGVTQTLWDGGDGVYFSSNDVLHVGIIAWLIYVVIALGPTLADWESGPRSQL